MLVRLRTPLSARRSALTGALCAVFACGGERTRRLSGDALEVLLPVAPVSIDPRFATDPAGVRTSRLVHAGLVGLDPTTLAPVPLAASGWQWETPRAVVFTLRRDLRFASGARLEAEDVCATIAALSDPAMASPHRAVASSVRRCEAVEGGKVRIALGQERATLITDMEAPVLRRDQAHLAPMPSGGLDGLGPYVVESVNEGRVVLAPREGGVAPKPAHSVVLRTVPDETARALRLLAGKADVVPNGLGPTSLEALEARGVRVSARPGANLTYLIPNHARAPFSDVRTRRATSLAIDRAGLARALFDGRARVAAGPLPPESWAAPADQPALPFDPALARTRFAEAGITQVSLLVSTDRARGTLARAIAQMLGDVGVRCEVVSLEFGLMLHRLEQGDFELALLQLPEIAEPNVLRLFFHSDAIPHGGFGANRARYANADVDAALEQASREPEREARAPLYHRALTQMREDVAIIPLFHEDQVAATGPRAQGFRLSAEGRWAGLGGIR